jgi:hypothetical protein
MFPWKWRKYEHCKVLCHWSSVIICHSSSMYFTYFTSLASPLSRPLSLPALVPASVDIHRMDIPEVGSHRQHSSQVVAVDSTLLGGVAGRSAVRKWSASHKIHKAITISRIATVTRWRISRIACANQDVQKTSLAILVPTCTNFIFHNWFGINTVTLNHPSIPSLTFVIPFPQYQISLCSIVVAGSHRLLHRPPAVRTLRSTPTYADHYG